MLDGLVGPTALVEMDWKDLSTREQREKDEKIKVRHNVLLHISDCFCEAGFSSYQTFIHTNPSNYEISLSMLSLLTFHV